MSKTSIFLPLALEYDPDERESLQKSLGVSENELLGLMMKIGRIVHADDDADEMFAQKTLMRMIQEHEVSANMVLHLACQGAVDLWKIFADGILLVLDAEKESKE